MAFVKDDHSFTRGVGAIASMDAASPVRRIAAARAQRAMERRDAIMALGAMRTSTAPTRGGTTIKTATNQIETGQESAFSQPASTWGPRPTRPLPPRPFMPPGRFRLPHEPKVKLPGSVISSGTQTATGTQAPTSSGSKSSGSSSSKSSSFTGGGGSGTSWTAPSRTMTAPAPGADAPADEPEEKDAEPAPAPKPAARSHALMYAAIGLGALWLLSRKK